MMSKYIFRLDDLAPNMNEGNYLHIKHILDSHEIKPLVGVIPDNKDPRLKSMPQVSFDFWQEMRDVQDNGWDIAMHGYKHECVTDNGGLLRISAQSELAGLPYDIQYKKLHKGKSILTQHHVRTDIFMPPFHSFDEYTLQALTELGFSTITDGFGLLPYWNSGLLFVPQLLARPRRLPFGVYTFCLHLNSVNEPFWGRLESFIRKARPYIISFSQARSLASNSLGNRASRLFTRLLINLIRRSKILGG